MEQVHWLLGHGKFQLVAEASKLGTLLALAPSHDFATSVASEITTVTVTVTGIRHMPVSGSAASTIPLSSLAAEGSRCCDAQVLQAAPSLAGRQSVDPITIGLFDSATFSALGKRKISPKGRSMLYERHGKRFSSEQFSWEPMVAAPDLSHLHPPPTGADGFLGTKYP
jgi:hypothetical protein